MTVRTGSHAGGRARSNHENSYASHAQRSENGTMPRRFQSPARLKGQRSNPVILSAKCIRFEAADYLAAANKRKQGARSRRPRSATGTGEPQTINANNKTPVQAHSPSNKCSQPIRIVAASALFAKMNIHDDDIEGSLIPLLESSLIDVPCTIHGDSEQKSTAECCCRRLIWLSLDLAENHLSDDGFNKIVAWLMTHVATIRLRSLKVYRNSIGDSGAIALAELIELTPWPIEEIHFSHNSVGNAGALRFMSAFLNCYQPQVCTAESAAPNFKVVAGAPLYPRLDPHRPVYLPVWLRLEYNYIQDTESLLVSLSKELQVQRGTDGRRPAIACFAEKTGLSVKDPNCSPKRCSGASSINSPLFHLYSFTHQLRPISPVGEPTDGLATHQSHTKTDTLKGFSSSNETGSKGPKQKSIPTEQEQQLRDSLTRDGGESGELSNDSMNSPQSENHVSYGKLTATTLSTQGEGNSNNPAASPILREIPICHKSAYLTKKSEGDNSSTFQDPQSAKGSSSTSTNRDSNVTRASTKAPLDAANSSSRFNLSKHVNVGQSEANFRSFDGPRNAQSLDYQSHYFGQAFLQFGGANYPQSDHKSNTSTPNLLIFPDAQACLSLNCEGSRFSWQSLVECRQKDNYQGGGLKGITFCLTPSSEKLFRKCISPSLFEALKLYGLVRSMGADLPPKFFSSPLEEKLSSQLHFSLVPGTYASDSFSKHILASEIIKAVNWTIHNSGDSQVLILSDDYGRFADFVHAANADHPSPLPGSDNHNSKVVICSVNCIRSELSIRRNYRKNKSNCDNPAHCKPDDSPDVGSFNDLRTPIFADRSINMVGLDWFLSLLEKSNEKQNLDGIRSHQSSDLENVSDSSNNPTNMQGPNGIKFPPVVCTPIVPRRRQNGIEINEEEEECMGTPVPEDTLAVDRSMLRTFSDISNKYFYSEHRINSDKPGINTLLRKDCPYNGDHEKITCKGMNRTRESHDSDSTCPKKSSMDPPSGTHYSTSQEFTGDKHCATKAFHESLLLERERIGAISRRQELMQEALISSSHLLNVLSSLKSSLINSYSDEHQSGSPINRNDVDGGFKKKDTATTVSINDIESVENCMNTLKHLLHKGDGWRNNNTLPPPSELPKFTSSNPCGREHMQSPQIYFRSQSGSSSQQPFIDHHLSSHNNPGYGSADEADMSRGPLKVDNQHRLQQAPPIGAKTAERVNSRVNNAPSSNHLKYGNGDTYGCSQLGPSTSDNEILAAHASSGAYGSRSSVAVTSQSPTYFTQLVSRLNQRLNDSQNQIVSND